ncbi:MAG: LptF/LptG family permease [Leptospiraceae bacterium]|nr:LptF/LptG family permease [Leptospiraceae bacterium]
MRLLDLYIGTDFLKATAFSLIAFTFIWLLFDIQPLLGLNTNSEQQSHLYLTILYRIPRLVAMVLPAATMFGVCFTVAQFTVSRELVAIFSAGISFYRAIAPVLLGGIVIAMILFLLSDFVVSPTNAMAVEHEQRLTRGTASSVKQDLLFQSNLRGREGYYFIYYYDREKQAVIGGFNYIQINQDARPIVMYQAREARYQKESGQWLLRGVQTIHFNQNGIRRMENALESMVRLPEGPAFFEDPNPDPASLNIFQILEEIKKRRQYGFSTLNFELRLHNSLAFPFMVIVLAVIGSIAGNMGSLRSGGPLVRSLLVSIISLMIYYATFSLFETLGKQAVIGPAMAAWIPTGFFMALAGLAILFYRR